MALVKKLKRLFLHENKMKDDEPKTQIMAFQKAMKLLLITGQCLGLNPSEGILETDVSKMRFSVFTWKFYYCVLIGVAQAIGIVLSIYAILISTSMSITALGHLAFYVTTCISTFSFLHLAMKWPSLMRELANCSLNEYIDRSLKLKCYTACVVTLILCAVEHVLYILGKLKQGGDCYLDFTYDGYSRKIFDWYYALGVPDSLPIFVLIQITNTISTINWNYSDIFIACISMYLVSILDHINKKIILASEKHNLPTVHWRSLREDYIKATRLVRSFDDVISGVVLITFANNLFFICLQVFNILKNIKSWGLMKNDMCPNDSFGILGGYEYPVYLVYSAVYLFVRSLVVSLIAASVNSASMVPAIALYNVPPSSFCPDVARFLSQVHANTVALSGLQFFHITRELVLSVAGTIVTYELVLLQVGYSEIPQN